MSEYDDTFVARLADRRMGPERRRQWIRRVLGCEGLTAAQKTVLIALETYADYEDGSNAHPGEILLSEICGLTTRAVRSALARGRELALIEQTAVENPRAGRAAVYRLVLITSTTGTAVPVKEPTTGTTVPVNNSTTGTAVPVYNHPTTGTAVPVTGTATSPSPEQPFRPPSHSPELLGVLRNWGTSPAEPIPTHTDRSPSKFCDRHPHGTRDRCGDCANARIAFQEWQAGQAVLDAATSAAEDLDRRRRRQLIDDCTLCDDFGRDDDLHPCDHPPHGRRAQHA
ncbi:hypothetical protein [Mycolicibacterium porcinum]|uniref:Helix-turn-helix domain-containing protein n=1 Tax=Mycolicibacterium porcinum TaxID=39693 RepID=A0ABV3VI58_9MYCO